MDEPARSDQAAGIAVVGEPVEAAFVLEVSVSVGSAWEESALADRPLFHLLEGSVEFEESGEFAAVADEPEPADHTGPVSGVLDYRGQSRPVLVNPWLIE